MKLKNFDLNLLVKDIKKISGKTSLHEPILNGNESKYLADCIKTGFISTHGGKYLERLKLTIKERTKSKYIIPIVNATNGLFVILKALGVNSSHEVLVPSMTFVGSVSPIIYSNATPHFVDLESNYLGIDTKKLDVYLKKNTIKKNKHIYNIKTGKIIKYLIIVHTFGHPSNMSAIKKLIKKYNLTLIEDSAEALGSYYKNTHVGNFGIASFLSFNGNKIITTGGGGVVITNNKKLFLKIKHLSTTAKIVKKKEYWKFLHDDIGYNFGLPNILAAIGCAQLEKLDLYLKIKRKMQKKYTEVLSKYQYFEVFKENKDCKSNYWLQSIILKKEYSYLQKHILKYTNSVGLITRRPWELISDLKPYKKCPKMNLNNSKDLINTLINIPSTPNLKLK